MCVLFKCNVSVMIFLLGSDLVNPAHGPNGEGCCLTSKFGCCQDNISPAEVMWQNCKKIMNGMWAPVKPLCGRECSLFSCEAFCMDGEKLTFAFLIRDLTWSAAVAASSRSLDVARTTSPPPEDQSSPDADARDFI